MKNYTDYELLELLENNGYEASYKNLMVLKEAIANGTSLFEEEKPEVEEESATEIPEEKQTTEEDAPMDDQNQEAECSPTQAKINLRNNGTTEVNKGNATVVTDSTGNISISLMEMRSNKNTETLLHSYLTEDCGMPESEYVLLKEETKVESIKTMASNLLASIEAKLNNIDTTPADRSKGDIKQLKDLSSIQDTISKLESLIEREDSAKPEYAEAIRIIIKSILYINQNSAVFKDAYRNKKTLMILKYESLILSIISSISYLLSTIVDYGSDGVHIKYTSEEILEFSSLNALRAFNKSVESGEFKTVVKDTTTLREFFLEVPVEKMGTILEAYEYLPMIIDSVKNIYSQVVGGENGAKITNILYRVAGVIVLIFSLRDAFYTMFRMKTKVNDMIGSIQNFASINNGNGESILSKLASFAGKFTSDASFSSDLAKREIEDENRKILGQVRQIQSTPQPVQTTSATSTGNVDFDDFALDF